MASLLIPQLACSSVVADVICGVTFGEGYDTTNPDVNTLLELNVELVANTDDSQLVGVLDFFPFAKYLPVKAYDRLFQMVFRIFDIIRKLLRERKENFDPQEPVKDLISGLLQARHQDSENGEVREGFLSDDYLLNTIEDMFIAGFETTSTAMKWAIAFLVNYPKYQEDIQLELDDVLGGRNSSLEDRASLPLVQATIMGNATSWKRGTSGTSSFHTERYYTLWLPRSQRYHRVC